MKIYPVSIYHWVVKNLHAYWRMDYVEVPQDKKTADKDPFLSVPFDDDENSLLIFRSDFCFAMLNKFPYNAGHAMVLPYRQVNDIQLLSLNEHDDLWKSIVKMQKILIDALHPDGFNIGFNIGSSAGAGIASHLHCHIVPRWNGDTNFMPVIADTKVLPQALQKMVARLRTFV